jgi:hypothetical protein
MKSAVFLVGVVAFVAAGCSTPGDPGCVAKPRGACGPGMWCQDNGDWDQCLPVPADRKACAKEKWAGECSGNAVITDGGPDTTPIDRDGSAGAGGAGGQSDDGGGSRGGAGGSGDGGVDMTAVPDVAPDNGSPSVDMGVVCSNPCSPIGRTECTTGGVRSCVMLPNGCAVWGTAEACPMPQTCPVGETKCSCPTGGNACSKEGDKKCGSNGVQTCSRAGACFAWSQPESCMSPQTCAGNAPNARCECPKANACTTEGEPKCGSGGGVQTCTKDGAGCLTWSAEKACAKAGERCMGTACVDVTCPKPTAANLVQNPGFDTAAWTRADKDRGYGARVPQWSSMESTPNCTASGSMMVTDRTAFSEPIPIGPPGTRYYWGFRAKKARATGAPYCELHFCTDESCLLFLTRDQMAVTSTDWQPYISPGFEVPTPNPPQPVPYAQIACFGYQEPNGPEVYYDRFFFSTQPISF